MFPRSRDWLWVTWSHVTHGHTYSNKQLLHMSHPPTSTILASHICHTSTYALRVTCHTLHVTSRIFPRSWKFPRSYIFPRSCIFPRSYMFHNHICSHDYTSATSTHIHYPCTIYPPISMALYDILQPRSTLTQPLSPMFLTITLCVDNTCLSTPSILDVNNPNPQVITSYVVITCPLAPHPRPCPHLWPSTPHPVLYAPAVLQLHPMLVQLLSPLSLTSTLCADVIRFLNPLHLEHQ